jgi:transglutaminase-like putative cysteine protease
MTQLDYAPTPGFVDELFDAEGVPRPATSALTTVAAPEDGGTDSVEVDTHAWVEALLPDEGDGEPSWVGADPTNRRLAGETDVKIGHGRHYGDVPPIKGVYRGAAEAEHDVSVRMTRLG